MANRLSQVSVKSDFNLHCEHEHSFESGDECNGVADSEESHHDGHLSERGWNLKEFGWTQEDEEDSEKKQTDAHHEELSGHHLGDPAHAGRADRVGGGHDEEDHAHVVRFEADLAQMRLYGGVEETQELSHDHDHEAIDENLKVRQQLEV